MNDLTTTQQTFSLVPRNLDEAFKLAEMLAESEMVPKDYRGKAANVLVAVQWGAEVGLKPLQALQNIAVINGRPSLWGDALPALVRASPLCEYIVETADAAGTAICKVKRKGEPEQTRTFSDADAKLAGLAGKAGPWATSPKRMKQMRARAFALRDVFPDVLKGLPVAEELLDIPAGETSAPPPASEAAPIAALTADELNAWAEAANKGTEAVAAFYKAMPIDRRRNATPEEKDAIWAIAVAADERAKQPAQADQPAADPANDDFKAALDQAKADETNAYAKAKDGE